MCSNNTLSTTNPPRLTRDGYRPPHVEARPMTWPKATCPSVGANNYVTPLYEILPSNNHCHTRPAVCYVRVLAVYSLQVSAVRVSVCTYWLHSTHTVPSSVMQKKIWNCILTLCVKYTFTCRQQGPNDENSSK